MLIITSATHQQSKRKILEAYYLTKFKPSLNNQLDIKITHFLEMILRKYRRVIHILLILTLYILLM